MVLPKISIPPQRKIPNSGQTNTSKCAFSGSIWADVLMWSLALIRNFSILSLRLKATKESRLLIKNFKFSERKKLKLSKEKELKSSKRKKLKFSKRKKLKLSERRNIEIFERMKTSAVPGWQKQRTSILRQDINLK